MKLDLTNEEIIKSTNNLELDTLKAYITYINTGLKADFKIATKIANVSFKQNQTSEITNLVLSAIYQTLAKEHSKEHFTTQQQFHLAMAEEYANLEKTTISEIKKTIFQIKTIPLEAISPEKVLMLKEQNPNAKFYDTSTNAPYSQNYLFVNNFSEFSPFNQLVDIPIPGQNGTSQTVEGVWQGLKIIKGKIDTNYFKGKGRKRYGKAQGHKLGDKKIQYIEARQKIYMPSYKFMLNNADPLQEKIQILMENAKEGYKQFLFDVDTNVDPYYTKSALAHSTIIVDYINEKLTRF